MPVTFLILSVNDFFILRNFNALVISFSLSRSSGEILDIPVIELLFNREKLKLLSQIDFKDSTGSKNFKISNVLKF